MNPKTITRPITKIPALLLLAAVLYSCGAEKQQEAKQTVTPAGEFPIIEEKMTMSAFLPASSFVDDYQDNDFVRYLEKKTNIYLEIETAPAGAEATQKRNLLMASGGYPEIFIAEFSRSEQQLYGAQGVFVPLNDLIAEYGVNVRKAFADYPLVKANMTMPDGTIYALPDINDCFHCSYAQKMWIYQPWLDQLGLEMPTTTGQFKEVLIAFRDRDPNGNGLKDEVPLSGAISGWHSGVDGFLMNAFVYTHGNLADTKLGRMYLEGSKITAAFAQPAWKDGLSYMNDLYKEGLMDPDAFTQDTNQYLSLGENPEVVLLGAGTAGHNGIFTQFHSESGRWLEYTVVPPLKGPDGARFARYDPMYGVGEWTITDKAKNPEAAFRLGDAFYELDLVLHSSHGREGIEWAWAEEGELGINGLQAIWKALVEYGAGDRSAWWDQSGPQARSPDFRLGKARGEGISLEVILYEQTKNKMEPYTPDLDRIVPPLTYSEEAATEVLELESALQGYVVEMIGRFTIGDADIETGWDDYLAELDKIGLPRYIELMQQTYDNR